MCGRHGCLICGLIFSEKDSPEDQDDQAECIQETYNHQNSDCEWGMLKPIDQFIKIRNIAWGHGVFAEYEHFTPIVL